MIDKIKKWWYTRKILDVQTFAHANRSLLVIVCDPRDDTMFVSYRDKTVCGKMKSADGKDHDVVKGIFKYSIFDREIDRFLGGVMEIIKLPLKEGNVFYSFLDGALFKISEALKIKKYGKTKGK